jgi:hypothetical protein
LTNRPESSVENFFASSTASLITTGQHDAVDRRQTFDRPALEQRTDQGVALIGELERPEHEILHERASIIAVDPRGRFTQHIFGRAMSYFGAIERLQRELARKPARGTHASAGAR